MLKRSQRDGVGTVLHDHAHEVVPEEAGPEVQGEVTEEVAVAHAKVAVDLLVEVAVDLLVTAHAALLMTAHMFHATAALVTPPMTVHAVRLMTALVTVHVIWSTNARVVRRKVAVVHHVEV